MKASLMFKHESIVSSLTTCTFKMHVKKTDITKEKQQNSIRNLKIPLSQQIIQTKHQRRSTANS